jgi:hypothetical protein
MHLAYYITGHGFGHAIRSATISNHFSQETEITFKTSIPESFFKREMKRDYSYLAAEYDCGCLQKNSVSVDIEATLCYYKSIAARNAQRLDDEITWCKKHRIDGIVSDIPPFVFDVAAALSIPSIAVTNFTWFDIYQEYTTALPWFSTYLDEMKNQYQKANNCLQLFPSLPLEYFHHRNPIPLVGRYGKNCHDELLSAYGIAGKSKKIGLIYVGDFGMAEAEWKKIEFFSDWEFFGIQTLPVHPRNYHIVDFNRVSYPDIIASSDCVIGKLGYGVVAECMINATPLLFLPRNNFAEYPILETAVLEWGGGRVLTEDHFIHIEWGDALATLPQKNDFPPIEKDGAARCAEIIETFICNS